MSKLENEITKIENDLSTLRNIYDDLVKQKQIENAKILLEDGILSNIHWFIENYYELTTRYDDSEEEYFDKIHKITSIDYHGSISLTPDIDLLISDNDYAIRIVKDIDRSNEEKYINTHIKILTNFIKKYKIKCSFRKIDDEIKLLSQELEDTTKLKNKFVEGLK